jgi:excisionase family DNA binding protein
MFDINDLPERIKLEITKGDLEAFAQHLLDSLKRDLAFSIDNQPSKQILTIDDAVEFTGLARQTIYGKISQRQIPFYKVKRKVYFRKSELEEWMLKDRRRTLDEMRDQFSLGKTETSFRKKSS